MPRFIAILIVLALFVVALAGCQQDAPDRRWAQRPAHNWQGRTARIWGPSALPKGRTESWYLRTYVAWLRAFMDSTSTQSAPVNQTLRLRAAITYPEDIGHGFMDTEGQHAGDMPNIYAGADGTARADYFHTAITLAEGANTSLFDDDGSAIIVHEKPDSYGADPGAGDRVACGVITR